MLISFSLVLSLSWILVSQTFQSQPLFKRPAARGDGIALFQSADPSSPSNFEQSRLPWWNFPGRLQSLELQFQSLELQLQSLELQLQSLKDGQKLFYTKEDALAMEERSVKRMNEMEEKLDKRMTEMGRLMVIMFAISSAIAAASGYFGRTIP